MFELNYIILFNYSIQLQLYLSQAGEVIDNFHTILIPDNVYYDPEADYSQQLNNYIFASETAADSDDDEGEFPSIYQYIHQLMTYVYHLYSLHSLSTLLSILSLLYSPLLSLSFLIKIKN